MLRVHGVLHLGIKYCADGSYFLGFITLWRRSVLPNLPNILLSCDSDGNHKKQDVKHKDPQLVI